MNNIDNEKKIKSLINSFNNLTPKRKEVLIKAIFDYQNIELKDTKTKDYFNFTQSKKQLKEILTDAFTIEKLLEFKEFRNLFEKYNTETNQFILKGIKNSSEKEK